MSELATVVLVVVPIEVDTDGVLALRGPSSRSSPGNASAVHSLVEVNLVEGKVNSAHLGFVQLTPQPPRPLSFPKCATDPLP